MMFKRDWTKTEIADISRGARWAREAYPGSYLDTTDPSRPRFWQFVDPINIPMAGSSDLVLRMSGADTRAPRYFYNFRMARPSSCRHVWVRIWTNHFSNN